jgi:hypothetical protein
MMKYIVLEDPMKRKDMVIFPGTMIHKDMAAKFPNHEVISAGHVSNHCDDFGNGMMDQVRFHGESMTLGVRSHPEDLEIFRRQTSVM